MKRKLAVAAILMLFCIAFVFASGAKDSSSEDQVVLRFSWWGSEDRHMATIEAIERYMELNPNVLIEYEYMGFDSDSVLRMVEKPDSILKVIDSMK